MTTIADAIMAANIGGVTTIAKGVDVNSNSTAIFDDAIVTAQNADIVVLALGNDRSQVCAGQDPSCLWEAERATIVRIAAKCMH